MANFDAQVKSLTGIDISNSTIQGYLTQWLTDGAREVTNVMPQDILEEHATKTEIDSSPGYLDLSNASIGKVFSVSRNDGSKFRVCRKVPPSYYSRLSDSTEMMYFADTADPAYYILNKQLHVYPASTDAQKAEVIHATIPTAAYNSDVITAFPDEAFYIVVNYASIKALNYLMNQISNDELDLVTDFADANNWLNTEEDNEMVSSRLSVIGAQINDFNTKRGDLDRLYKWYKDQYTLLKQDYAMGLRMFTRGSLEQGEQQGARG